MTVMDEDGDGQVRRRFRNGTSSISPLKKCGRACCPQISFEEFLAWFLQQEGVTVRDKKAAPVKASPQLEPALSQLLVRTPRTPVSATVV